MLASAIIALARDVMQGFDYGFLPTEDELLRQLSEEQRRLVEELILVENLAIELPGDASAAVNVAVYAESYVLPATLWRIRQATLTYSTGNDRPIARVPSSWRKRIPQYTPALYIAGSNFFPIDGGSTRRHGWANAATVEWDFVTLPTDLTDEGDTIAAPDEAREYLGKFLAHFMGVRGKVAEQSLREITQGRNAAKERLMSLAGAHPGAQGA